MHSNNSKDIPLLILPIETKVREFHGKMFFTYMAALRGFKVIVGDQSKMRKYADLFPCGVYIDKSVASTRTSWFEALKQMGHRIISWDEEGLIFFSPEVYQKLRLVEESIKNVELFFCWGDYQKNIILNYFPQYQERVHVCGNPRFDLLRTDFRKLYSPAADAIKKKYGRIILINTNFAFHNHFRSQEELREMLNVYPLAQEPGFIDGWLEYHKVGFETFIGLIPLLSKRYSDHTIIIRPHPSENHDSYKKASQPYSNVRVNGEGNVHEWIMASDLLLHDNCTTAVESFILGVPPFAYRKIRQEQYDNFLPRVLSYSATSEEELFKAFDRVLAREPSIMDVIWSDVNFDHLNHYISGLQNETSVDIMLEQISATFRGPQDQVAFKKKIMSELKLHWRNLLNLYRDWRNPPDGYSEQKFPGTTDSEIKNLFVSFDKVIGRNNSFSIKKITKDIYSVGLKF